MDSFLYCSPYIYLVGNVITIKRAIQKRSLEPVPKIKQRRLRAITSKGSTEKNLTLQSHDWKTENLIATKSFRIFGVSILF